MSSRDQSVSLYLSPLRALCSSLSRSNASIGVCKHPVLCVLLREHTFRISSNTVINHRGTLNKERKGDKNKTKAIDRVGNLEFIDSFLYLFNVLGVNIRQGKGGDCRHVAFAFFRKYIFFSAFFSPISNRSHCNHNLPAIWQILSPISSKSSLSPNKNEAIFMLYKSLFSTCFFSFHSRYHSFKGENRCLQCSSLVLSDLQAPGSGGGGPCGWGINPVAPYREVCLVNF